jgi:dienelactone hydrolase
MKCLIVLMICLMMFSGTAIAEEKGNEWYDNFIFKDKSFVFEFIRVLGYAYSGGADLGECIAVAKSITDRDVSSWYDGWKSSADRLYTSAVESNASGHKITAAELFLRASNYYRVAGFYLRAANVRPKALVTWQNSVKSFNMALPILGNIEKIEIPYESTTLPGYFVKTKDKKKSAPLLIVHTGFDGTGEELYFEVALAAIKRGYNCLIFEGPGQGAVIREQGLSFRYDWEKVVSRVVDYALIRPDVDKDNIALMGISMGGYLAPRAAAFEERLKACIANGGIFSMSENMLKAFPPEVLEFLDNDPEQFNAAIESQMKEDITTKWFFENGMWTFNAKSPEDFMRKLQKYTLEDVAKQIKCHMLVIDSEDDMFFKGQPKKLYDALDCPKDYILFTKSEAAQAHCKMGATAISNAVIFDWLDKVFENGN